ncbi:MAG: hypothetical protein KTR29_24515 [Rhodothermaceae bacterium]|nr:hypothetical protein [Rhodothermaceae bacterium]
MSNFLRYSTLLLALFLVPSASLFAQGTAEEVYLEELLSARHLPKYAHKDVGSGMAELQNNATAYLALIDNELVFPSDLELDTYFDLRVRYGRLIGLLESIGSEEARAILESAYGEVVDDMELLNASYQAALNDGTAEEQRLEISRDADAAYSILVDIIYVFKRLDDDRLIEDLLSRYEGFNYVMRLVASRYNDAVGSGQLIENTVSITAPGWHMVGMPNEPLDNDYASVYSDLTLEGMPWVWTTTGYEQVETLTMGEAYWIDVQTGGDQTILGVETTTVSHPDLPAGWNNLSGPSCDYAVNELTANHPAVDARIIYGWQPENGYVGLQEGDFISQGTAFWVFLNEEASLSLSCPGENPPSSEKNPASMAAFKPVERGFQSLTVSDAQNRSRSLYFGSQLPETIQSSFALPPIPPLGSFDVRFADGVTLVEGASETMDIQVSTDQYPVVIELDGQAGERVVVEEIAGGQVVSSHELGPEGNVEITNRSVSVLRVRME